MDQTSLALNEQTCWHVVHATIKPGRDTSVLENLEIGATVKSRDRSSSLRKSHSDSTSSSIVMKDYFMTNTRRYLKKKHNRLVQPSLLSKNT